MASSESSPVGEHRVTDSAYPASIPATEPALADAEALALLVRVLRVAFPHDSFPDGPYQRTADALIDLAGKNLRHQTALRAGLGSLNAAAGGDFGGLSEVDALAVLKRIEHTDFFQFVRANTITTLYNDAGVWELLGYEGPSFDKGGYINRGFDDLDWLPNPRIETYEGDQSYVERGPLPYTVKSSGR